MGRRPHPRPFRAILLGTAAATLLAGCEAGQFGVSGRDAEWGRQGQFAVVSASPRRAVVSARGRAIAVEPPAGFCVAEDSIETSDRSAFVLIGDCVLQDGAGAMPIGDGGLDLPPGMPGITTVSISGDPGFGPSGVSAEDLSELESYLATGEGRELLGRGGSDSQVSVVETRRDGDILYILVEDRAAEAVPLLAPRFWRAFVELNGRLAVVTVSGFRDVPMDETDMLRHLGDQVRQLQVVNAGPLGDSPVLMAQAPEPQPAAGGTREESPAEPAEVALVEVVGSPEAVDDPWAMVATGGEREAEATETEGSSANEWLALAEGAVPAGAAGGPDPIDDWSDIAAEEEGQPADWPTLGEIGGRPAPRPMALASNAASTSWPMPSERPGEQAPVASPGAPAAAAADIPVPMPRLSGPADAAAERPAGATAPLPPRRVIR